MKPPFMLTIMILTNKNLLTLMVKSPMVPAVPTKMLTVVPHVFHGRSSSLQVTKGKLLLNNLLSSMINAGKAKSHVANPRGTKTLS